jgi:hypothetical protein
MKEALIAIAILMFIYGILAELYRSFPKFKKFMNFCMHTLVVIVSIVGAAIGISSYGLLGMLLGFGCAWLAINVSYHFFFQNHNA